MVPKERAEKAQGVEGCIEGKKKSGLQSVKSGLRFVHTKNGTESTPQIQQGSANALGSAGRQPPNHHNGFFACLCAGASEKRQGEDERYGGSASRPCPLARPPRNRRSSAGRAAGLTAGAARLPAQVGAGARP